MVESSEDGVNLMSEAHELGLFAIRVEDVPEEEDDRNEIEINDGPDEIIEISELISNIIADNSNDISPTRPNSL